jgi:hypothetical protein
MQLADLIGRTFDKWTVISRNPNSGDSNLRWICKCVCGHTGFVSSHRLMKGKSKGCKRCANRQAIRIRPFEALFNRLVLCGAREHKPCSLTYEEFFSFAQETHCHYCNADIKWAEYCLGKNGSGYNLDRKDNDKGYVADNVVVCCKKCNQAKGDRFTYEQWHRMTECLREPK